MKDLIYPNVVMENEIGVMVKEDNGKKVKISNPMGIKYMNNNIDTNEESARVWYKSSRGIEKYIDCSRGDYLEVNKLMSYQKYGLDVIKRFIVYNIMHFRNEEVKAELRTVHSTLGFGTYNDKEIFKHHKAIGIDSTYIGDLDVAPKGSKEVVRKLIIDEILDYPPAVLVLLFSLSAVVIGYLSEIIDIDTTIIHLLGNTTTGKSTMSKFAVSLFGNPGVKKNGLFFTYNATDNALFKKLCGLKGIPVAIDELSMASFKDRENFVYKLAGGKNKDRLNSDSELTDSETWVGTVISNGEKSLIGMCSKNAGNKIRVIEPQHVKWTKSAKHAEKISEVIMNNYGYEGYDFAKYVMKQDKANLKKRYEDTIKLLMKEICKEVVEDNYTKRRVNKYALVYLTGELYMEMIQQEFSLSEVVNMFIDIEKKSMKDRNFERSALDYIGMYIDIHASKFKSADRNPKGEVWGQIKDKENYTEVAINPLKFEEILKEGGYEDKDVVLNTFKKNGILSCDKDRYTRKRKMQSGVYGKFIVLKIKKGDVQNDK